MENDKNNLIHISFKYRYFAALIDGLLLVINYMIIIIFLSALSKNKSENYYLEYKAILLFFLIFSIEPILISLTGSSIGQYLFGIKVIDKYKFTKCKIIPSYIRYILKIAFGIFSLLYMAFNRNFQAIHDRMVDTIVIISPNKLSKNSSLKERGITSVSDIDKPPNYMYPSPIRKFLFFLLWTFAIYMVLGITLIICMEDTNRNIFQDYEDLLSLIYFLITLLAVLLGANGLLPGARNKKI